MAAVDPQNLPVQAAQAVQIVKNDQGYAAPGDTGALTWLIKNLTHTAVVYLGPDNAVTSANGFPWDATADGALRITLEPGEALWGRLAAGAADQALTGLKTGR